MISLGSLFAIWLSISERVDFSRYKDRGVPVLYSETVDSVLIEDADELAVIELQEGEVFGGDGTQVFWGGGPELRLIFRGLQPGSPVKVLWAKRANPPGLPCCVGHFDASMAWDRHRRAVWIASTGSLPGYLTVDLQRVDLDSRFDVIGLPAPTQYRPISDKGFDCRVEEISVVAGKDAVSILPQGRNCSDLIFRFSPETSTWAEGVITFAQGKPCSQCVGAAGNAGYATSAFSTKTFRSKPGLAPPIPPPSGDAKPAKPEASADSEF